MSTVKVNELSTWTGNDISIETGKTVAGTASQFKMTDVVQGDVLYGSAADTLSRLAPGTSGQFLQTTGAGANPVWASVGDNTPSFAAYNPADQNLTNSAYVKITATTEVYDTGSCYDAANAKFTVPAGEAGKYAIWTRTSGADSGGGTVIGSWGNWIYLNGSASQKIYWSTPANSTISAAQTFFGVLDLSAADYLEWYIWSGFSSGTVQLSAGPAYSNWGVYKLAGV